MENPYTLTLLGLIAATDVGLVSYLFHRYDGQGWFAARDGSDASRVRSIMTLVLFTASWTTLFAFAATSFIFKRGIGYIDWFTSGLVLLWIIPLVLWVVSTSMVHRIAGGGCQGQPLISLCHQLEAVEALGWTPFVLLTLSILAGCCAYEAHRRIRRIRRTSRV